MIRSIVLIFLAVILAIAVIGGGALAYYLGTSPAQNAEFDRTGTLQGTVFDATNGERLGGRI